LKSYVIAERSGDDASLIERVTLLSRLGADFVQLRDKESSDASILTMARSLRKVVTGRLIINSRDDVALDAGADGLHLPSIAPFVRPPRLIIGRSCHSYDDCQRAVDEGSDYVFLGPVYATRSKDSPAGVSLSDLARAARLPIEVFALGGIRVDTLAQLADCGIAGVAAITMFMADEPIGEIMETIRTL
jgi:thiamine-phosphate pyrophosphorylase